MKRKKSTKQKTMALDAAMLGPEPSFAYDHNLDRMEYLKALNWYSATLSREDSKAYVAQFLKEQKRKNDLKKLSKVPPAFVGPTYGAIARMLSNDVLIPDSGAKWLNRNLKQLFETHVVDEPKTVEKVAVKPVNIQDRIEAKARQVAGEIDNIFEDNVWFNTNKLEANVVYNFLHSKAVSGQVAAKVAELLTPHLEELKSIKEDPQLKEGYKKYTKADIKRFIEFYQNAVDTCTNFNTNVKKMKVRKPRAKKDVPLNKKVAGFPYLKQFNEYQLASVNLEKVVGAEQVWLYHPKYRALTVLNAIDRGGIQIKGKSFVNYDEKTSLRKDLPQKRAEEVVKGISVAGKRAAQNIWNDVVNGGSTRDPKARSDEQTLILAVF